MLAFAHLLWLWIALALAAGAAAAAWTCRRRSWRWRTAGILLPTAAAICLALALAQLSIAGTPRVILLLDFSASTRDRPWRDPAFVRQLAQLRLGPAQHLTVVAFGGREQQILLPDSTPADPWPARFNWDDSPAHAATDFQAALAWRTPQEIQAGAAPPAARWLITDGLAPWPPHLVGETVAVTLLPPAAPDAAIRDLILRPAADDPAAVEILVQVRAVQNLPPSPPAALIAKLEIRRDDQLIANLTVDFPASAGRLDITRWVTLRDRPPPDAPRRYAAVIHFPRDPWPENDSASAIWTGSATGPRILVIGRQKTPSPEPMTLIPTDQFTQTAQQLVAEGWQTIILDDVPARDISPARGIGVPPMTASFSPNPPLAPAALRELDRFVRHTGGGLLLLSRGHAFGPGHYGEIAPDLLENLSPVASRPPLGNNLHAIFLLDASASMNEAASGTAERKFALLSHAVEEAARLLGADDHVTIIAFNRQSRVVADGPAAAATDLRQKLATVQVGGETAPDCALPDITAALATPARHLLFFITDGEIPAMNIPQWQALLAPPTPAPAPRLRIIAPPSGIGSGIGVPPMSPSAAGTRSSSILQQLAATIPGTTWSQTSDPSAWADTLRQLLATQVQGKFETSPPAPPLTWRTTDDPSTTSAAAWTRTWLKPESIPLAKGVRNLFSPDPTPPSTDIPVAAVAQRGLGKVAAITLAELSTPAAQTLLNHTLRAISPPPGDRRFSITTHRENDGIWLVQADGLTTDAPATFLNGQSLFIRLLDDSAALLRLTQTAPGHYQARVAAPEGLSAVIYRKANTGNPNPADAPEQLVARIQSAAVQTTEWPATIIPLSAEDLPPHTPILSPAPTDATRWQVPTTASISLTPVFWLAAALAALTALWLRK